MILTDTIAQLDALDPNSEKFHKILLLFLSPLELSDAVFQLQTAETQRLIDIIDRALDSRTGDQILSRRYLRALRGICGNTGLLPSSHMLSEGLKTLDDEAVDGGGFADVWFGEYHDRQAAIKALRIYAKDDLAKVKKRFCKEVVIWRRLSHPYVVPFIGVSDSLFKNKWCMVSEWMTRGNVTGYVKLRPEVDRLELLKSVAKGLQYLHDSNVVHGDLKGQNILVDDLGHPRLADFGLACILCDPSTVHPPTTTYGTAGSVRWMAPELLNSEIEDLDTSRPSRASDVYAFGMVVYEVFTGNVPFPKFRDSTIINFVLRGSKLERPASALNLGLSNDIWETVKMCWQLDPGSRPEVSGVLRCWDNDTSIVADGTQKLDVAVNQNPSVGTRSDSFRVEVDPGDCQDDDVAARDTSFDVGLVTEYRSTASSANATDKIPSPLESIASVNNIQTLLSRQRPNVVTVLDLGSSSIAGIVSPSGTSSPVDEYLSTESSFYTPDSGNSPVEPLQEEASNLLRQLMEFNPTSDDYSRSIHSLLPRASAVGDVRARQVANILDETLDAVAVGTRLFQEILSALQKNCGLTGILPSSYIISAEQNTGLPDAQGSFSDVWKRTYRDTPAAFKVLRIASEDNKEGIRKKFCQEAVIWKRLSHPNIVRFFGVTSEYPQSLVSEWMIHGNMTQYVRTKLQMNRVQLLVGICTGLEFLHSLEIVHGDLKGNNILINSVEQACLADFGSSVICSSDPVNEWAGNVHIRGTYRWMAPELLDPDCVSATSRGPSKASDIYALAMVAIELFSGRLPFHEWSDPEVIFKVMKGNRPARPKQSLEIGLSDKIWVLIESCWQQERRERPVVSWILGRLQMLVKTPLVILSPPVDRQVFLSEPKSQSKANPQTEHPTMTTNMSSRVLSKLLDQLKALPDQFSEESIQIICSNLFLASELEREPELAKMFIDLVDRMLDTVQRDNPVFRKCLSALRKICGHTGLLPSSYILLDGFNKTGEMPAASGGSADVWQGSYKGNPVAFKNLRIFGRDDMEAIEKGFCKEAVIWKRLLHPNIVPFLGITSNPLSMVCQWMPHGNMTDYVRSHPETNRPRLLMEICEGLKFLHSSEIVHGDLKGSNILIDSDGIARLADFGFTSIISHLDSINPSTVGSRPRGTFRWMAPELLVPDIADLPDPTPSTKSDIYALAMVVIELFTGEVPFPNLQEPTMIYRVVQGQRPLRPAGATSLGLSDGIWKIVETCWHPKRELRPSIEDILERLR